MIAMIAADTPIDTVIWSSAWKRVFQFRLAMLTAKAAAFVEDGKIEVIAIENCFASEAEAWRALATEHFTDSQRSMEQAQLCWDRAQKAGAKKEAVL